LINKWRNTVEAHNKKLKTIRTESLNRSVSRDRVRQNSEESDGSKGKSEPTVF
jgi:hypothetical protein